MTMILVMVANCSPVIIQSLPFVILSETKDLGPAQPGHQLS
jgi:hypothetical protein